jgi:hypothetical protein
MKRTLVFGVAAACTAAAVMRIGYLWGARAATSPVPTVTEPAKNRSGSAVGDQGVLMRQTLEMAREQQPPSPMREAEAAGSEGSPSDDSESEVLSPAEARDRQIQKLRASGIDRRHLRNSASDVGEAWSEAARRKKLDVSFAEWECYAAGCFTTALHGSAAVVDEMTQEITHSNAFLRWNSGKMRSGSVATKDGKTAVTWVLFSPADGDEPLQPETSFPQRR